MTDRHKRMILWIGDISGMAHFISAILISILGQFTEYKFLGLTVVSKFPGMEFVCRTIDAPFFYIVQKIDASLGLHWFVWNPRVEMSQALTIGGIVITGSSVLYGLIVFVVVRLICGGLAKSKS
jgi:hypothetical protein